MTTDELEKALRAFCRRRPYRIFLIEMVSGDRVRISHPETVRQEGDLFLYTDPLAKSRVFSASSVCQLLDPPG
jgi:hypothetical protein